MFEDEQNLFPKLCLLMCAVNRSPCIQDRQKIVFKILLRVNFEMCGDGRNLLFS